MIREITNPNNWNSFLLNLNPNTFLQSWEWGQVQRAAGEDVRYLGIFENDQQIGACLVLTVHARRGPHFLIPHGPILAPRSFSEVGFASILPEIVEYLKNTPEVSRSDSSGVAPAGRSFSEGWKRGSLPIALRIAPLLRITPENAAAFKNLGFRHAPMHVHAELTWMLDINKPEEELLAGMRKTTRHAIRHAEQAGVTFEITTDSIALSRFTPLYEQTKHRHDFVPYSSNLIESQFKIFNQSQSPNVSAYLTIARYQGEDVAAGIFFQFGTTVFYYHGASASRLPAEASAKAGSLGGVGQLLQWESIREARRRGAARFNFWGIAPQRSEGARRSFMRRRAHPFEGITVFKTGFGGYAIDYMHAQDLPFSTGYWKLWLVDTYRKIRRGF